MLIGSGLTIGAGIGACMSEEGSGDADSLTTLKESTLFLSETDGVFGKVSGRRGFFITVLVDGSTTGLLACCELQAVNPTLATIANNSVCLAGWYLCAREKQTDDKDDIATTPYNR